MQEVPFLTLLIAIAAVFLIVLILIYPKLAMSGASDAVRLWIDVLVPCLMPYCAAASMLAKSGLLSRLSRPLSAPTRRLTGFSGCFSYVVLISALSGYPNGARLCGELYSSGELNEDEAARMINVSSLCGPSFIVSAVCAGMLENPSFSKYLLIPHYLSFIVMLLIFRPKHICKKPTISVVPSPRPFEIIADSVGASCYAMLNILGFTLIFSVVGALISGIFPAFFTSHPALYALLSGFLEMTSGCKSASRLNLPLSLVLISFIASFGGLSVICQTASAAWEHKLKTRRLFVSKLIQGALSAVFTFLYMKLSPPETAAFSPVNVSSHAAFSKYAAICGIIVLLFSIVLLFLHPKSRD